MILVDSSVWIDYFRNESTTHTAQLDLWLDTPVVVIATADLVVFEVMRGFRHDRARLAAQALLLDLPIVEIGGIDNSLASRRALIVHCAPAATPYVARLTFC
jgi:predicted nucleic acid-binding protein